MAVTQKAFSPERLKSASTCISNIMIVAMAVPEEKKNIYLHFQLFLYTLCPDFSYIGKNIVY